VLTVPSVPLVAKRCHVRYGAPVIHESEARHYVLDRVQVLPASRRSIAEAMWLVLAEPIVSAEDVPPFENSAVDGYAVRAADVASVPVELEVIDEVAAGAASALTVGAGQAIRIMTGAPMPAGADAAIMVEDTERLRGGTGVLVKRTARSGDAVRVAGDDVRVGDALFAAGDVVTPPVAGVLSSINAREVAVFGPLRVGVLSTGDELIDDGSPLAPGQIRESNKTMLLGMVAAAGAITVDYGVVRDDEAALEATLRRAARECDAVVTSGGVSMGDYDVVKAVLSRIADMRWMQIAIKPAKPFAFGMLDDGAGQTVPVFGLPGNPVSSMVSFELFARPALQAMLGRRSLDRLRLAAISDQPIARRPDGKTHYARVLGAFADDGRYHIRSVGGQGSHQLAATAAATALAVLPDGDGVTAGDSVDVIVLSLG
jgi:molybdopterin molybdotransferase